MTDIWANLGGGGYPEKEMEMAWSHPAEAFLYHHQASFDLNSSREAKKRSSRNTWRRFAKSIDQVHIGNSWYQLESKSRLSLARKGCKGQLAMKRLLMAYAPEKE